MALCIASAGESSGFDISTMRRVYCVVMEDAPGEGVQENSIFCIPLLYWFEPQRGLIICGGCNAFILKVLLQLLLLFGIGIPSKEKTVTQIL